MAMRVYLIMSFRKYNLKDDALKTVSILKIAEQNQFMSYSF